jgi:hypothetical protein
LEVVDLTGGGSTRTSDLRIMGPSEAVDSTDLQKDVVAKCGNTEPNPHPIRTKIPRGNT